MPPRPHFAVKLARNCAPKDLAAKLALSYNTSLGKPASVAIPLGQSTGQLDVYNLKTLPVEVRSWIWALFEQNMKSLYERSEDGWDEPEKRKELFHSESRFFVVRTNDSVAPGKQDRAPRDDLLGYSIFRFDTEETAGEEDADVVYCYELQVEANTHGKGVGKALMGALARIGRETKMDKIMLTVFKANEAAIAFYRKIGYAIDEIDPSNYEDADKVDYNILSYNLSELRT